MEAAATPQPPPGLPTRSAGRARPRFRFAVLFLLALALAPATTWAGGAARQAPDAAPTLVITASGVSEGHVRFEWRPAGGGEQAGVEFELEESPAEDFAQPLMRYRGLARATFVSGLEEGPHWFRLRQRREASSGAASAWSPWSAPILVEITPHPMSVAWALFATGGALFAAVVGFLVVMAARTRAEDEADVEARADEELEAA